MPSYKEGFVRLLYAIIVVEFVVITVLLFGFSNEYLSNAYMRTWINANLPVLGILLHGEVDALFIGVAIGAMVILVQRRVREAKSHESMRAGVKVPGPGHTSTSLVQDSPVQSDQIREQASPSRSEPNPTPHEDDRRELKKTVS